MTDGFEDSINFEKASRFFKPTLTHTPEPDQKLIEYYQTRALNEAGALKFPGLFENRSRMRTNSGPQDVVESVCRLHSDFDFWRATVEGGLDVVEQRASLNLYSPVLLHSITSALLGLEQLRAENLLQKRAWDQYFKTR